jgi:hypothetical protein
MEQFNALNFLYVFSNKHWTLHVIKLVVGIVTRFVTYGMGRPDDDMC